MNYIFPIALELASLLILAPLVALIVERRNERRWRRVRRGALAHILKCYIEIADGVALLNRFMFGTAMGQKHWLEIQSCTSANELQDYLVKERLGLSRKAGEILLSLDSVLIYRHALPFEVSIFSKEILSTNEKFQRMTEDLESFLNGYLSIFSPEMIFIISELGDKDEEKFYITENVLAGNFVATQHQLSSFLKISQEMALVQARSESTTTITDDPVTKTFFLYEMYSETLRSSEFTLPELAGFSFVKASKDIRKLFSINSLNAGAFSEMLDEADRVSEQADSIFENIAKTVASFDDIEALVSQYFAERRRIIQFRPWFV